MKRQKFHFTIPVTEQVNKGCKLSQVHQGDIEVKGEYSSDEDYDYDFIKWNEVNPSVAGSILPLLDHVSDVMDYIRSATKNHLREKHIEKLQQVA